MANNERLKQIISDIRQISDLTDSMKDAEIYPVSFFSQAFDLMQKIQSAFHLLEADQVEMFASQMKKHQALILSIHRQMRTIEGVTPHAVTAAATTPAPPAPETKQRPTRVTAPEYNIVTGQNESKSKKAFFLDRLGLHKNEVATDTGKQAHAVPIAPTTAAPAAPPETKTPTAPAAPERPVTKIIEDAVEAPAAELSAVKRPARPMPNPLPVSETAKTTEKSTITLPVTNSENLLYMSGSSPVAKIFAERAEAKSRNTSNGIPAESNFPPSVHDAIEKRILSDLRRAFSLNDRFRYRHELFRDNEEVMNRVISILNTRESYKESLQFLEEKLHWDFTNPVVKDFIKVLELRFL
jgi:hypothetical protein